MPAKKTSKVISWNPGDGEIRTVCSVCDDLITTELSQKPGVRIRWDVCYGCEKHDQDRVVLREADTVVELFDNPMTAWNTELLGNALAVLVRGYKTLMAGMRPVDDLDDEWDEDERELEVDDDETELVDDEDEA